MYPEFSRIAREEGFPEIADTSSKIAVAEKQHEKRYRKLYDNMEQNIVFKKNQHIA